MTLQDWIDAHREAEEERWVWRMWGVKDRHHNPNCICHRCMPYEPPRPSKVVLGKNDEKVMGWCGVKLPAPPEEILLLIAMYKDMKETMRRKNGAQVFREVQMGMLQEARRKLAALVYEVLGTENVENLKKHLIDGVIEVRETRDWEWKHLWGKVVMERIRVGRRAFWCLNVYKWAGEIKVFKLRRAGLHKLAGLKAVLEQFNITEIAKWFRGSNNHLRI